MLSLPMSRSNDPHPPALSRIFQALSGKYRDENCKYPPDCRKSDSKALFLSMVLAHRYQPSSSAHKTWLMPAPSPE